MISNVYDALDEIKLRYYNHCQGDDESNTKHTQALNDLVASIEHHSGNIWLDEDLLEHETMNPDQLGFSHTEYENTMK